MRMTWTAVAGAVGGVVAAAVWALSLAVYQPFMQPHGFYTDPETGSSIPEVASNNTYWPRDIRQFAILLAVLAVVLIAGSRPRAVLAAAGSAVVWLALDLWLDRIDLSGRAAAGWLALVAVIWFAATAVLAVRLGARQERSEPVAYLASGTAAVLAVVTTLVSTPWEEPVTRPDEVRVEDALTALKVALAVALALVAVGLVAQRLTRRRAGLLAAFAALAAAAVWPATTAYGPLGALGLFGMPVLASLAIAATRSVPVRRLIGVALLCATSLLALVPLYFTTSRVGAAMTAAVHNPPVNGADTDLPLSLLGLALGVLLALVSYITTMPVPWRVTPAPAPVPRPDAGAR